MIPTEKRRHKVQNCHHSAAAQSTSLKRTVAAVDLMLWIVANFLATTIQMASLISSLFTSASSAVAARVDSLRIAEAALAEHVLSFGRGQHSVHSFDTRIPRSALPLKGPREDAACQINTSAKGDDHYVIHGVKVTRVDEDAGQRSGISPLVILHGYMNGSMYFYRNLAGLADYFGSVYSLDQLGSGLSSRPSYGRVPTEAPKSSPASPALSENERERFPISASESFFVESLEAWRRANSIDRMNLCGHSLGGYLGVAYAEKYPQHVDTLLLLSPVGVPEPPSAENDPMNSPNTPLRFRILFGTFRYLWARGTTPGDVIRSLPESQARRMIDGYVENRLRISSLNEKRAVGDYLLHNALLPGSGEYALSRLLNPGAYAKRPTVLRIPKLKVDRVAFVYGQNDWMDYKGGIDVQRRCNEMRGKGQTAPEVEVLGVSKAGHMLMIDNYAEANAAMILGAGGSPPKSAPAPGRFVRGQYSSFFQGSRFRPAEKPAEEEKKQESGDVSRPATAS